MYPDPWRRHSIDDVLLLVETDTGLKIGDKIVYPSSVSRAGKETTVTFINPPTGDGTIASMSTADRLEFERLLLYLRLCFLVAPLLLLASYGWRAIGPSVQVEFAILVDCAVAWSLLHWFPGRTLRGQLALRGMDLAVTYIALHFVHLFLANAYYDSVYLLFVLAATATHGRRGTYIVAAASALAVSSADSSLLRPARFPSKSGMSLTVFSTPSSS